MIFLVVGYGSIGKRHARLLAPLAKAVEVVTSQPCEDFPRHRSIREALSAAPFTHVIICTQTSRHGAALRELAEAGFTGQVLVEKPLAHHAGDLAASYPMTVHVAYQLRFHPAVVALKHYLRERRVLSVHAYVGQHLGQWRPGREVRQTYSAYKAQGGGVVRDLSHELDLLQYLLGTITQCHAITARTSNLTVDSEDAAALALSCTNCPVISLQLNYLDHEPKRKWWINTEDASITLDLIAGTLKLGSSTQNFSVDRDDPYQAMHRTWLDSGSNLCRLDEALALCQLIDKVAP
ncbi:MAG: Gfo/Idh/MocA family oxidoreductase [Alphaproteobacteria bacterium]|nr:Gfo/Idh/MocA family oxidoreductase [Alphaproteobacteria bacterium]